MKTTLLLIGMLAVLSAYGQENPSPTHREIKAICGEGSPGVVLLTKDDTVVVKCDSLYALSAARYRLYEMSRQYILSLNPDKTEQELLALRKELEALKTTGKAIGLTYDSLESSFGGHLDDQQQMMIRLKNDLTTTRNDLEISRVRLQALGDDLQKMARSNRSKNLFFASGGLVSGLLLGLLIAN